MRLFLYTKNLASLNYIPQYDLTDTTTNNRELKSSWSSGDEWCYCENRRFNGGRDDDDDDRFDDDDDDNGLSCRDIEQRKRYVCFYICCFVS